ncbi:MAG: hypothetical protein HPY82_05795 [Gammaproteobacteria bacterium]|nr:hypothetical protein [Gammaproteobacteria bacterium]
MSHKPEEVLEALMASMNGIIEDELLMAALKLEPPPAAKIDREDLKRYAQTKTIAREGKLAVEYTWRGVLAITVMEPSIHPSGRAMVFAVKRHLENGRVVTPKLRYDPPPAPPAPGPDDLLQAGQLMNDKGVPGDKRKVWDSESGEVVNAKTIH